MKNPLNKRILRELKSDFGKYAVIFLFMIATIGFVSGFLVADNSMQTAYDKSFEKYNIEDGHFILESVIDSELKEKLSCDEDITVFESFYKDETETATYRIYKNRDGINGISILEGSLAESNNEIAIDRLFAENNNISIGDKINLQNNNFTVCGLVAFSDYSALFRKNTDMMFDAQNFSVAAVTEDAFENLDDVHLKYCYSYKFNNKSLSYKEKSEKSEDIMKLIASSAQLNDFVSEADNQAIHFTGDDMGNDKAMMIWLLYIVIVIMAFVFAITTTNTIEQEASVIGTLRASGYTKGEMICHYLLLPVAVTLTGAALGNILGYTIFKNIVVNLYYGSYSLPQYKTVWSGYAFVMTTVIPCIIMLIVNLTVLIRKLNLSPLKFLRRDLKKNKNKKAVRLPDFKFISRFRIRTILQNKHGYLIMFIGILFANVILMFGLMMTPLLEHYEDEVLNNMICEYQYILKSPAETNDKNAERFSVTTLETDLENKKITDEITVYGIENQSDYISLNSDCEGVTVSNGILEKYGLEVGDTLNLKTKYGKDIYSFKIGGSYDYPASLCVFMSKSDFCNYFNKQNDYYNGYFSDTMLDINENNVSSLITRSDLTIISEQLFDSMGNMFPLISAFAVLLYMLLVYLLSKIIIEKNALSVSMVKILGFQNSEVSKLYIVPTAAIVLISIVLSIPISYLFIRLIYVQIISSFSGWLSFYIKPVIYVEMILLGIVSYAAVGALQFIKIRKIPMQEALKNTE